MYDLVQNKFAPMPHSHLHLLIRGTSGQTLGTFV